MNKVGAWLAGLVVACAGCNDPTRSAGDSALPSGPPPLLDATEAQAAPSAEDSLPDFLRLFEQVSPAVVNVSAAHDLPIPEDLLPRRERVVWKALARSLGSGFAIDELGHVVTCSSVIQDAQKIEVILADGQHLEATLVAADEVSDLAILAVDPGRAPPPLPVAEPGDLRVGDWVAAIGYPFGLSHSITSGIVSAIRGADDLQASHGLILADAAINPGCNGGPLLDMKGRVVGINVVPGQREGGLGLAIPIHDALPVLHALAAGRTPRHAWLGVSVQYVDAALAHSFHLPRAEGALVSRVQKGSPGDRAGILVGDILTGIAGRPVEDPLALIEAVKGAAIGKQVEIQIYRKGKRKTLTVKPTRTPL